MRYFGGGVGHLKNAPPQQVPGFDPINPISEEMAVEDEDLGTVLQKPSSDAMNICEMLQLGEVNEEVEVDNDEDNDDDDDDDDDGDDSDSDEGGDQTDEDDEEEEEDEEEDDYGYASA